MDLAKRLIVCKNFSWMPGMLTTCGVRLLRGRKYSLYGYRISSIDNSVQPVIAEGAGSSNYLPDLTDSATLGCLLKLVRELYGEPHMAAIGINNSFQKGRDWAWLNHGCQIMPIGWHESEATALVAALETYNDIVK